ncbi:MAG: hypothetical protein U5R06_17740 [candidate division KSB1 bacterium]|nr:hypothetical protein [candidate division KSB1 bacterium]
MQQEINWQEKYKDKIVKTPVAMKAIKPGNSIFIGTGCVSTTASGQRFG